MLPNFSDSASFRQNTDYLSESEWGSGNFQTGIFQEEEFSPLSGRRKHTSPKNLASVSSQNSVLRKNSKNPSKRSRIRKFTTTDRLDVLSDDAQRSKAVDFLTQSYIILLKKHPGSVDATLSFLYFLNEFTNQKNIIRYQIARLDLSSMALEQQTSFLRFKVLFEQNYSGVGA